MADLWGGQPNAQALLNKGLINQGQYDSVYGTPAPPPDVIPAAPDPMMTPVDPAPPMSVAPPVSQPAPIDLPPPAPAPTAEGYNPFGAVMTGLGNAAVEGGKDMLQLSSGGVSSTPPPPVAPPLEAEPQEAVPSVLPKPGSPTVDPYASAMKEAANPFAIREQAMKDMAKSGEMQAAEEGAALDNMKNQQTKQLAEDTAWAGTQRKALDDQMMKLSQKSDEIAAQKIDPKHYWADKSTGDKIMSGIALVLGGFGAAKSGENQALKVINAAIDRDIDLQRADIQNSKDSLSRKYTLFGDAMANFKDERIARDAARVHGIEIAQMGLQSIAAKYKGLETKAKAQDMIGQLETQKQIYMDQMRSGIQMRALTDAASKGLDINPTQLPKELAERYVSGYGFANDHDGAKILRARIPAFESSKRALGELINMAKEARSGKISPEMRARADQYRTLLQGTLREDILGPGTVQESERKLMDRVIADPNAIFTLGNEGVRLEILLNNLTYQMNKQLNVNGIKTQDQRFKFKAAQ